MVQYDNREAYTYTKYMPSQGMYFRCKFNVDESNRMMLHVAWLRKPRPLHKHV